MNDDSVLGHQTCIIAFLPRCMKCARQRSAAISYNCSATCKVHLTLHYRLGHLNTRSITMIMQVEDLCRRVCLQPMCVGLYVDATRMYVDVTRMYVDVTRMYVDVTRMYVCIT